VTNARHIDALRRARVALVSARDAAETEPGEIVAGELRVALAALGEVTGEAVAPDLLERIFARFCIGK
jgi:tRNA modification GTPase